jgi:hypothetical protein
MIEGRRDARVSFYRPAVADALEQAAGHGPPFSDAEGEQITELHVVHAQSVADVARCRSLTMLILNGCDAVDLRPLAGLPHISTR